MRDRNADCQKLDILTRLAEYSFQKQTSVRILIDTNNAHIATNKYVCYKIGQTHLHCIYLTTEISDSVI